MTDDAPLLLDVTRLIWRRWKGRLPTGIDRVCLAYLQHFGGRAQAVVQHDRFRRILGKEASQELFDLLDGPPQRFRAKLPVGLLRHFRGLRSDGQQRFYLNIGHTGLNSAGFREWVGRSAVRPIYLVHDLIPITHPEFCRAGEPTKHEERMRTVLATATGVIGNSQVTLDELAGFAHEQGLPMPSSFAAWLGSDPLPAVSEPQEATRSTFVIVGTIEGRKNHAMLLDIWSRLVDEFGNETPQLLIIGQRGWEADAVFERLDHLGRLREHVIELNQCSDSDLARYLASARALLFPSLAEGFGLPLVEALSLGVPVIASDLPVFHEIGREIPTYLAPLDLAAWEKAVVDYAQPQSLTRRAQLKRMKGFSPPTWLHHFAMVEDWIRGLG